MRTLSILLVEDEPIVAHELKLELEKAGHRVITVSGAENALWLCERNLPDIAVLNFLYKKPVDGMELARSLRTRYLVKVLFITGATREDIENSAYFYAGHEVLFKPFTKLQLWAALNVLIEEAGGIKPP